MIQCLLKSGNENAVDDHFTRLWFHSAGRRRRVSLISLNGLAAQGGQPRSRDYMFAPGRRHRYAKHMTTSGLARQLGPLRLRREHLAAFVGSEEPDLAGKNGAGRFDQGTDFKKLPELPELAVKTGAVRRRCRRKCLGQARCLGTKWVPRPPTDRSFRLRRERYPTTEARDAYIPMCIDSGPDPIMNTAPDFSLRFQSDNKLC